MIPINFLVQGGLGIASGIIGHRKRKAEQAAAEASYQQSMNQYRQQDLSNPYQNMENPYEDLTVNLQAADYQREMAAQSTADTMATMKEGMGGSGVAAMAQALANQSAQSQQQISASIGAQEAQNQAATAQMAGRLQSMEREGDVLSRQMKREQYSTELGMDQQRLAAANAARQQATQALVGGIGTAALGFTGFKANQAGKANAYAYLMGDSSAPVVKNP